MLFFITVKSMEKPFPLYEKETSFYAKFFIDADSWDNLDKKLLILCPSKWGKVVDTEQLSRRAEIHCRAGEPNIGKITKNQIWKSLYN